MKSLISLILLLISTSHALAETTPTTIKESLKQYDVEIILFEDSHSRYINSQTWAQETKTEDASIIEPRLKTEDVKAEVISNASEETYSDIPPVILKSEFKRINISKEYNVLFYGSWRQAGLDKKKAFSINIEKLKNLHKSTSGNTITGNLKLVLARYLHIYGELDYQINNSDTDSTTEDAVVENKNFPMSIHRRMRSKELHYIDHPLVGILIQINPSKVDNADVTAQSKQ